MTWSTLAEVLGRNPGTPEGYSRFQINFVLRKTSRPIQRALPPRPAEHRVHPDISAYVSTGTMPENSTAHMPAFETLSTTSAAAYLDLMKCPCKLTVSVDFSRTVEEDASYASDCCRRSVQWILASSPEGKMIRMMTISPFQAQELLPKVCQSKAGKGCSTACSTMLLGALESGMSSRHLKK